MDALQEALKQKLVEEAEVLVAHGGPAALTVTGRVGLYYEPDESWFYEDFLECGQQEETYYPLMAVLATLGYPDPSMLQDDWNEVLGKQGPLPLYLHRTADGHYSAMMTETVVLRHLILLTDGVDAVMMAD
jgi:hypothetical protein